MEYQLGSRMHLDVVHPRLEARGQPFQPSPRSRLRVNLHVLRPLTRGPQGQPSHLRTAHRSTGVQGIFSTSCGPPPHRWPMVHHSMATGFSIPRGCCLALWSSIPSHVPFSFATSRHRPNPSVPWFPYPTGLLCGPFNTPILAPSPILSIIPCLYPTSLLAT